MATNTAEPKPDRPNAPWSGKLWLYLVSTTDTTPEQQPVVQLVAVISLLALTVCLVTLVYAAAIAQSVTSAGLALASSVGFGSAYLLNRQKRQGLAAQVLTGCLVVAPVLVVIDSEKSLSLVGLSVLSSAAGIFLSAILFPEQNYYPWAVVAIPLLLYALVPILRPAYTFGEIAPLAPGLAATGAGVAAYYHFQTRQEQRRQAELTKVSAAYKAAIQDMQRTVARLQQDLADGAVELEATVDEFNRATAETEEARKETERANNVKSAFLASVSHELRTPLNAILNFSQFLSTGMLGPVTVDQVDMLEKIVGSGKHLLNLINDVLDISKIEAGSLRLFVEANVNVEPEIQAVADIADALLKDKPVELRLNVAPDLPLIVADKRRVRQILLNLVSNACKFTDEGHIEISVFHQNGEICMSVLDTGVGILPEDWNIIFDAFRQSRAGLRQGTGTGLGLAISRRLAEAHGGRLWLESQIGVGSTFFVALPIQTPELLALAKESQ